MPLELVVAAKQRARRIVLMKQHLPEMRRIEVPKLVHTIVQQRQMSRAVPTRSAHRRRAPSIVEQHLAQDRSGPAGGCESQPQILVFVALLGHAGVVAADFDDGVAADERRRQYGVFPKKRGNVTAIWRPIPVLVAKRAEPG